MISGSGLGPGGGSHTKDSIPVSTVPVKKARNKLEAGRKLMGAIESVQVEVHQEDTMTGLEPLLPDQGGGN